MPMVQRSSASNQCRFTPALWLAGVFMANIATAQGLQVVETDRAIIVRRDTQVVLTYNKVSPSAPHGIASIFERSGCLHPVNSPQGRTVTQMFPVDHPHQNGVFSAWVKTSFDGRSVDFWNSAKGTGQVVHERVVATFQDPERVGFVTDLIHRAIATEPVDVLRERWKVTVYPTDGTYHCFDVETKQTALTDKPLHVKRHHYGGMVVRGPTRWLRDSDPGVREFPDLVREPSRLINSLGSGRVEGNQQHARWVALSGSIDGKPVMIAVLGHADNFRAPQAARLHPTKPYFCFVPCIDGDFSIVRTLLNPDIAISSPTLTPIRSGSIISGSCGPHRPPLRSKLASRSKLKSGAGKGGEPRATRERPDHSRGNRSAGSASGSMSRTVAPGSRETSSPPAPSFRCS